MILSHEVFNQQTFYPALHKDMANARGRVAIRDPYATVRQVKLMQPHIENCIRRNVAVCCFLRLPSDWDCNPSANPPHNKSLEGAISILQSVGAHVTLVPKVHEKVVVIDDEIVWDGSLNILSHFDTTERMTRVFSPVKAREALVMHNMDDCPRCYPNRNIDFSCADSSQAYLQHVGSIIANSRRVAGLSQAQLGAICGLDQKVISIVERGKCDMRTSTLNKILTALGLETVPVPRPMLHLVQRVLNPELRRF